MIEDIVHTAATEYPNHSQGSINMSPNSTTNTDFAGQMSSLGQIFTAGQRFQDTIQEEIERLEIARTLLSFAFDPPRVFSPNSTPRQALSTNTKNGTQDVISEVNETVEAVQTLLLLSEADAQVARVDKIMDHLFSPRNTTGTPSFPEAMDVVPPLYSPFTTQMKPKSPTVTSPAIFPSPIASLAPSLSIEYPIPTVESPTPPPLSPSTLKSLAASSLALVQSTAQNSIASISKVPAHTRDIMKMSAILCPVEEPSPTYRSVLVSQTRPFSQAAKRSISSSSSSSTPPAKRTKVGAEVKTKGALPFTREARDMDVDVNMGVQIGVGAVKKYGCSLCERRFTTGWHRDRHVESRICVRTTGRGSGRKRNGVNIDERNE